MCDDRLSLLSDNSNDDNPYPKNIRRLAAALVENAYSDYPRVGLSNITKEAQWLRNQKKRNQADALEWFARNGDTEEWGTFQWCCEILQIRPEKIRNLIARERRSYRYRYR